MTPSKLIAGGLSANAVRALAGDAISGLIATGTTQATALALIGENNVFSTVGTSSGAILPVGESSKTILVYNGGANALSIYPPVGGSINALSTNTAYSLGAGLGIELCYATSVVIFTNGTAMNLSIPGAIGDITPGSGAFTTLSASGAVSASGLISTGAGSRIIAGGTSSGVDASATRGVIHAYGSTDTFISWGTTSNNGYIFGSSSLTQFLSVPDMQIVVGGASRLGVSASTGLVTANNSLAVTGTLSSTGNATISTITGGNIQIGSAGTGSGSITLGPDTPSANGTGRIKFLNSNTGINWAIAGNDHIAGGLEFTPSTATGGGTFTTPTLSMTAGAVTVTGTLTASGAFGCNTKSAQTAFASGGALATYGAGVNGFDTAGNASALYALVVAIRAALVANGIMS